MVEIAITKPETSKFFILVCNCNCGRNMKDSKSFTTAIAATSTAFCLQI